MQCAVNKFNFNCSPEGVGRRCERNRNKQTVAVNKKINLQRQLKKIDVTKLNWSRN